MAEAAQQWKIGDVTVTKVVELTQTQPLSWLLPEGKPEAVKQIAWLAPQFADDEGLAKFSIHALIVESQGQRIIVDTCIGNDKNLPGMDFWTGMQSGFLSDLSTAGAPADSVDTVLCTHLHVDHVGWNTRLENGRWVPTFPNARYLWSRAEHDHWMAADEDLYTNIMAESVRPVFDAGQVDLVDSDHVVTDEVRLEPTPGHTPGHVSVHITSRGEEAIITGDFVHHPAQCARPEWFSSFDYDRDQGIETRRSFFSNYAYRPVLIIGTHFAGVSAGKIVRDGKAWRLDH